jgi:hypothetical protein
LEDSIPYGGITIGRANSTFIDGHNAAMVRIVNASAHLRWLISIGGLEGLFNIEGQPAHHGMRDQPNFSEVN